MSFIYVYTNDYFNDKNIRKIGSTLNPYIRLSNYITYYQDKGVFEYLFKLDCDDPYKIDEKIKNVYLSQHNTRNNGSSGGTEIYNNIDIKDHIIKCFIEENLNYEELDPLEPPITKKYSNNVEKDAFTNFKREKRLKNEKIVYNKYKKKHEKKIDLSDLILIPITPKKQILDEIFKEFGGELIERTRNLCNVDYRFRKMYGINTCIVSVSYKLESVSDIPINIRNKYGENNWQDDDDDDIHVRVYVYNVRDLDDELNTERYNMLFNSRYHLTTDKVSIFDVPITNYKCSLNETGRKKYGKLDDLIFTKISKVGTKYGYVDLPEIRKSKYVSSIFEFEGDELEKIVMGNIKNIVSEDKQHLVNWTQKLKYTVLKYREGDFFSEHRDHKINKNHYGTLLIFPPAINNLEHTGGEFVIETDVCDIIIPSYINKTWKFIAFQTQLKHACHKILSGRRIVIKVELLYKKNNDTMNPIQNESDYEYNDPYNGVRQVGHID